MKLSFNQILECEDLERLKAWTRLLEAEIGLIKLDLRDHLAANKPQDEWFRSAGAAKVVLGRRIDAIQKRTRYLKANK